MGLGPALREAMEFDRDGVIQNATFRKYRVPHFADTPTIDIHLLDRPDLASAARAKRRSFASPRRLLTPCFT